MHVFDRDSLLDRLRDSHKYIANRYEILESVAFSKVFDLGLANGLVNVATFLEGGASAGDNNFGPISVTIGKVVAKAQYRCAALHSNMQMKTWLATVKPTSKDKVIPWLIYLSCTDLAEKV